MIKSSLGRKERRTNAKKIIMHSIAHIILIFGALCMLVPFLWALSTSFKEVGREWAFPPEWIPKPFTFENYIAVWQLVPFGNFVLNSFKISLIVTFGRLFICSMAAYAFARLEFPGRDAIFLGLLGTMMVPMAVLIIPRFIIMRNLGWINTHAALIVPDLMSGAYGTFLLRQFMKTIPMELEDAARIDGASSFQIYFRLMMPLIKPAMATLGVFTFMFVWNDFMRPLIYMNTVDKFTVQLGLAFFKGLYVTDWTWLMAGSIMSLIPLLASYIFAQRYFVKGIVLSGLKM